MLIIWDEAPIMTCFTFEVVCHQLKDMHDNQNNFGGQLAILDRDFRHMLPMVAHRSCESIVMATFHQAAF